MMSKPYLSKSKYLVGLQCHKLLWTHYNAKDELPPVDDQTQAVFDQGHEVGILAQKLFPNGMAVGGEFSLDEAIDQSRRLVTERKPLFEAAFASNRTFARVDVLNPVRGGKWDIIEVKSSTNVKDHYLDDVAFQRFCFEGAGISVRRCYLMHINNKYVRDGEVDPAQLFTKEDITEGVIEQAMDIKKRIQEMLKVIGRGECPEIKIGPHCSDPYECPFASICWQSVERVENNVFSLTRLGAKAWGLYEEGVVGIDEIPGDFFLSERQRIQVEAERTDTPFIDRGAISEFLHDLDYPLYFLDFETFQTAIPLVDGTRPYQQVPFQFSLHVAKFLGSEPDHYSWLWDGAGDPRRTLLDQLLPLLGNKGSIIVYSASFETTRLRECVEAYSQFSARLDEVLARIVDLYAPFRAFAVYYPAQHGSASLKKVLPSLTGKDYSALAIQDGGQASDEFKRVTFGEVSEEERQSVLRDLEAYCGLDTLGMLDIIKALALIGKQR
jgi:aromatic ring-cleaving dioxygenase